MSRTIRPELWRAEIKGQTIRKIQARGMDMPDVEIDIEFKSGARYRVIPGTGCTITAAMVNITRHANPISSVVVSRPADDQVEIHVYGMDRKRCFSVYAEGIAADQCVLAEVPFS